MARVCDSNELEEREIRENFRIYCNMLPVNRVELFAGSTRS